MLVVPTFLAAVPIADGENVVDAVKVEHMDTVRTNEDFVAFVRDELDELKAQPRAPDEDHAEWFGTYFDVVIIDNGTRLAPTQIHSVLTQHGYPHSCRHLKSWMKRYFGVHHPQVMMVNHSGMRKWVCIEPKDVCSNVIAKRVRVDRAEKRDFDDDFKKEVVDYALNLPKHARIKPTCREYGLHEKSVREWIRKYARL
jgi:hypothetical protein